MKLLVTTPMSTVLEVEDVRHVRAEDDTGAFGIQPGHADFITALDVSVITWRGPAEDEHHIAVRGGVLTVHGGNLIEIATREATGEDALQQLGRSVLERFRREAEAEEKSRFSGTRLQLAAIRQLQRYLASGRQLNPRGLGSPVSASSGFESGQDESP